jgi:CrcB protein
MIKQVLLVALGGGAGSALRYLASCWVGRHVSCAFPLGTLAVNVSGCLLIGLLAGLSARGGWPGEEARLLLVAGFCGGYTTFSAFSIESVSLLEGGHHLALAAYALSSVVAGAGAAWLGVLAARHLF